MKNALLGELIRSFRKRLGENQAKFGMRFNVSASSIYQYESGRIVPDLAVLLRMWPLAGSYVQRRVLAAALEGRGLDGRILGGIEAATAVELLSEICDLQQQLIEANTEIARLRNEVGRLLSESRKRFEGALQRAKGTAGR